MTQSTTTKQPPNDALTPQNLADHRDVYHLKSLSAQILFRRGKCSWDSANNNRAFIGKVADASEEDDAVGVVE